MYYTPPVAIRKTKTVSLSPDLDSRLDRFPDENWSAVATEAFTLRVRLLELSESSDADERAVARLEASMLELRARLSIEALEAGVEFVRNDASYGQLKQLRAWFENRSKRIRDHSTSVHELESLSVNGFRDIALVMAADEEMANAIDCKFRERFKKEIDSIEWISSFVEGALTEFERLSFKITTYVKLGPYRI